MEKSLEAERAADNQALFRTIKEQIEQLNEAFDRLTPYCSWVCECADTRCLEPIDMTLGEYEQLRTTPDRFVVLPDEQHVVPGVERVVEKGERYWIVEKIGTAGEAAAELAGNRDALARDHEYWNGPIA